MSATQQKKRIYLSSPHMGGKELQYVNDVFATNWIAPIGPHVDAFEQEVAQYVGVKGAVAMSSGTAAIHIALRLLDIQEGDLVFCSDLTFVASANPILYEKATPVFIDSDLESWNMSPSTLERALDEAATKKKLPKAVIVVNIYGQSAKMEDIARICNYYDVPFIEDAAESLGARYKNKQSGCFGKFGIFSFNGNKIITTSGGGMLVSNDLCLLEKAKFLVTQARDPAPHYEHSTCGYNYRMSNLLAAIGRGQLEVLNDRVERKRKIYQRYQERLKEIKAVEFMPELEASQSNRWLTTMTINPGLSLVTPADIIAKLESENIEARPVWKPLHLQPLFKDCKYYTENDGNGCTEYLFDHGVCLPSATNMMDSDQDRIIQLIKDAFHKSGKPYRLSTTKHLATA